MLKRKKLIIWLIVILAVVVGGYFYLQSKKPKTQYMTADVTKGNLTQTVSVTGTVSPDSQVNISFENGGKLVEMYVASGDSIQAGDKIAKVDDSSFKLKLSQAEDDVIYQEKTLTNMEKNEKVYSKSQRKAQEALISKALSAVETAKVQLANTLIYSPINGTVLQSDYKVGEVVSPGVKVATISSDDKSLIIESNVPESDIVKIASGQKSSVGLDAFGQDQKFDAEVYYIDPASTVIQDVVYYQIKLKFTNPSSQFKPGMSADIDIRTAEADNVLMIPVRAVDNSNGQKTVQILGAQNKIDKASVTTGLEGDEGMIEVQSGLSEGQKVITYVQAGA